MAATLRIGLRQPRIVLSLGTVGSSVATQLGIPGPTGAAGPTGPAGPPGAAANWRGAYSAATVYAAGDAVEFGGVPYVTAAAVGPGVAPPTSPWALITGAEGPQGPAGPAGPAGAAGPTGATGATGPQGPQGVIPFSGPSVGTLQGFWVGSTQPPDNTWIWIVTDVPVGGPASVSAVAALLGMSAIPPGVQSVGSPITIAAAAVAMGLAAVVPTVQAQGGAAQITAAVALVPLAPTAPVVSQRTAGAFLTENFDLFAGSLAYVPGNSYVVGNIASYNGHYYRCIQNCTNIAPTTNTNYWEAPYPTGWTRQIPSSPGVALGSPKVNTSNQTADTAYASAPGTFAANHYAEGKLLGGGPVVRCTPGTPNGYRCVIGSWDDGVDYGPQIIVYYDGGSTIDKVVGSYNYPAYSGAPGYARIEVTGTGATLALTVKTKVNVGDLWTTIFNAINPAVAMRLDSGSPGVYGITDDFAGGDL